MSLQHCVVIVILSLTNDNWTENWFCCEGILVIGFFYNTIATKVEWVNLLPSYTHEHIIQ